MCNDPVSLYYLESIKINGLDLYKLSHLEEEYKNGLRIQVETAWGWADVAVGKFLSLIKKSGTSNVVAFTEVRRCGSLTLKVPRRA